MDTQNKKQYRNYAVLFFSKSNQDLVDRFDLHSHKWLAMTVLLVIA